MTGSNMAGKNDDEIKLIIKGENEYSAVSEEVRQELEKLANEASQTQEEFVELEKQLDLAETYRSKRQRSSAWLRYRPRPGKKWTG